MTSPARLRRLIFAVLLVGMAGTAAELWLTSHTEDAWQWLPLGLLVAGVPMAAGVAWRPGIWLVAGLRGLMVLFIAAGALGLWFHYDSNAEFAAELSPGISGFALIADAMTRSTPPPLAPGTMIMLGLLGLVACYGIREDAPVSFRSQGD